MDVQVELRIKAMQPVLIPGPEQIHPALGVLDVGESTYQDLGSVGPGKGALIIPPGQGKGPSCKLDSTMVKQRASSSTSRGQASSLTGDKHLWYRIIKEKL